MISSYFTGTIGGIVLSLPDYYVYNFTQTATAYVNLADLS
jgi:hypothetical protein